MALTSTIYNFAIDLSNVERGVYENLELRIAQHPSETPEYLVTRVLAWCLEYAEGIQLSNGIADPDEPSLSVRDLTGRILVWIDIGSPTAARLHKASKAAERVVVYTHKDPDQVLRSWAGERIHRASDIELYAVDRGLVADLVERLTRRMAFALSLTGEDLYVTVGDETLEGPLERHPVDL